MKSTALVVLRYLLSTVWRAIPTSIHWQLLWIANPKFNIGVCGLVVDASGRVLILRHVARKSYQLGLPSGWVKRNETVQKALEREVYEEIGVRIETGDVIQVLSGFALRIDIAVAATIDNKQAMRFGVEVSGAEFHTIDDLPQQLLPAHRALILKHLKVAAK